MTSDNTPSVTDALIAQLTRQPFDEEAIRQAIALLHASLASDSQIDDVQIARRGARDWKFFHTVYDNLVTLEKILDKHLTPEQARRVWQRIELIQAEMDRAPKSFGWMINQVLRKPTQVPR
jgi:hypothetical protein